MKRGSKKRSSTGRSQKRSSSRSTTRSSSRRAKPQDAIALLKADHRQVEEWFSQFEKSNSSSRKQDLAQKICAALKAHTSIEEEIFYPAFLEATEEKDLHHEAEVEHDGAKKLIAQIERSGPDDDYFDARVTVLSEMIKHHVKEEEQRDGMFAEAKKSDMDLVALGEQMAARKAQIMGEAPASGRTAPRGAALSRDREARMASGSRH